MNIALNELEHVSLGVMAQVLLHTQALPLQVWRSAGQINQALGTAPAMPGLCGAGWRP